MKWAPFQSIPGYSKMVHDAVHNFDDEELTYDDEYRISLDYALSSCNESSKKAAVKYHDGKRYRLITGYISSFDNGVLEIASEEGIYVEIEASKISNIEPL